VHEVFECIAVSGCKRITHETAGIPPMLTLNVKEKNLFSGLFGGGALLEKCNVYDDEKVLIMGGRKGLQIWSAVVEKPSGNMSGTIAQAGRAFTQFGTCVEVKQASPLGKDDEPYFAPRMRRVEGTGERQHPRPFLYMAV
jgi:hypothetical protein